MQRTYGDADVLRVEQLARPRVGDREVLVRVRAAGLDRGTWHLLTGRLYPLRLVLGAHRPPSRVPGLDVAGNVVEVGPGRRGSPWATRCSAPPRAAFAEYAATREDKLVRKPAGLSFEQAAVVPVSGLTAQSALLDAGRLQPGQEVLVTGASGGVGNHTEQLAKALGAEVTAMTSPAKLDLVRTLGADHVLDRTRDDPFGGARRCDLIIDIAGDPALAGQPPITRVNNLPGHYNSAGIVTRLLRAAALDLVVRQRLRRVLASKRASDLARLTTHLEAGTVKSTLERAYPLHQVPGALRHLVGGSVRGKIAITV